MQAKLVPEGIHLVTPPQTQGGPPGQEVGHVRPQPAGQGEEAGRAEAEAPQPIEGHQDRRGVAAPPSEAPTHGDALVDLDLHAPLEAGVAAECFGRSDGQVLLAAGDAWVVATRPDAGGPGAQHEVVMEVDGLEQRPQLVVAVLAPSEHLQAEVDLRVAGDRHDRRARGAAPRAGPRRARRHRPPHSRRASAASTRR